MYLEFTTEQFAKLYPDKWNAFPLHMKLDFMADKNYIFRVRHLADGRTAVEVGYPEDNWNINSSTSPIWDEDSQKFI